MNNLRVYGARPFRVAVIHGGPGAPGEMAPVARELASISGILEPLQTAASLEGQVRELHTVLQDNADIPVLLIGHSWGAWLSYIVAARYPALVRKLVLIGSGPYEEKYAVNIMGDRLTRLSEEERVEVLSLTEVLGDPETGDKNTMMARFGKLMAKADSCNPLAQPDEALEYRYDINRNVWAQASRLRKNGKLLELGRNIRCPVVAVHGADDPHPAAGVKQPLARVLKDFRFILLKRCGHYPWLERYAKDRFYEILKEEVQP